MNTSSTAISIRPATAADLPIVLFLVPRLVAFDVPLWRDGEAVRASSESLLLEALTTPPAGSAVLLASSYNEPLGFVHLETTPEFFTGEPQGYVANLAVKEAGEGKGVGKVLIDAAERWTKEQGMRHLTLYVFAGNARARAFYARLGFEEDSFKLVKKTPA